MKKISNIIAAVIACFISATVLTGCGTVKIGGTSYDKDVSGLNLNGKSLTNKDIENIGKFENVTYLDIRGNFITDWSFLSNMTGLQQLYIDYSQIENNADAFRGLYNLKEFNISLPSDLENKSEKEYWDMFNESVKILQVYPYAKFDPDLFENIDSAMESNAKLVFTNTATAMTKCETYGYSICPGIYYGRIEDVDYDFEYTDSGFVLPSAEVCTYEGAQLYLQKNLWILMGTEGMEQYYFVAIPKEDSWWHFRAAWSYWDFTDGGKNISESKDGKVNGYKVGFYPGEELYNEALNNMNQYQ